MVFQVDILIDNLVLHGMETFSQGFASTVDALERPVVAVRMTGLSSIVRVGAPSLVGVRVIVEPLGIVRV